MSHADRVIHESHALCRTAARRAGSNFYTAFLLLPEPKRRAMEAIYAFTRYTDDLIDNPQAVEARREALTRWRAALQTALCHELSPPLPSGHEPEPSLPLGEGSGEGEPTKQVGPRQTDNATLPGEALLPALAHTVERFHIPVEHLLAVVDGVGMDLDRSGYETFDELATYCERVASAVGLACIHVWGFRGEEAVEPARKCGLALQLTNILRDLREDAEQGRVYLPREEMCRFEYSPDDLAAGVADHRFHRLMEFQIARARRLYREGAELFERLEPDGRRVFGMMITVYHRLLERIALRPGEVFRHRVRLGRWEKLRVAARWALLPARRSALP